MATHARNKKSIQTGFFLYEFDIKFLLALCYLHVALIIFFEFEALVIDNGGR